MMTELVVSVNEIAKLTLETMPAVLPGAHIGRSPDDFLRACRN